MYPIDFPRIRMPVLSCKPNPLCFFLSSPHPHTPTGATSPGAAAAAAAACVVAARRRRRRACGCALTELHRSGAGGAGTPARCSMRCHLMDSRVAQGCRWGGGGAVSRHVFPNFLLRKQWDPRNPGGFGPRKFRAAGCFVPRKFWAADSFGCG